MKKLFLLLPVMLAMLVTGCLKEGDTCNTIVLLGTESEIKSIGDMGMDTLLNFMDYHGFERHQGMLPPDIQGEYVFVPEEVEVNDATNAQLCDSIFFRFEGQHNRLVSCDIEKENTTLAQVSEAFVMGKDSTFTVYFPATFSVGPSGTQIGTKTRGFVITGKKAENVIENVVVAFVDTYEGEIPEGVTGLDEIDIFVYHKGEAVAYQWFNK